MRGTISPRWLRRPPGPSWPRPGPWSCWPGAAAPWPAGPAGRPRTPGARAPRQPRRRPVSRSAPARGGRTRSCSGSPRARSARSCRARPRSRTRPGSGPWLPRCAGCRRLPGGLRHCPAALPGMLLLEFSAQGHRVPPGAHPGLRLRQRQRARDGPAVGLVITARTAAERGGRREGPADPGHPSEQRADRSDPRSGLALPRAGTDRGGCPRSRRGPCRTVSGAITPLADPAGIAHIAAVEVVELSPW